MSEPTVIVEPGHQKPLRRRHPWLFSGAIRQVHDQPQDGELVAVRNPAGEFLGRGTWNSHSQIHVRILSWDEAEPIDEDFWRRRLARAIQARQRDGQILLAGAPTAYRLVNAENDYLPGLVVDRYADWLVIQALTLGIDRRKAMLADLLAEALVPAGVFERSDADVRHKEGLPACVGPLWGKEPPALIEFSEHGYRFLADVRGGHKTGFYLDQRDNRAVLGDWLRREAGTPGRVILNVFSYTGGFAVYALGSSAQRVINLDSSAKALALARRNVELNGLPAEEADYVQADAFQVLREYRAQGLSFDAIILDPPKFAQSPRQVQRACRGYKDVNLLALQLLKPGGLLMTFSCSGAVDADLFQKVVFGALADAKRDAQILQRLGAGHDHPTALTFPEGTYLKGLLCRVW